MMQVYYNMIFTPVFINNGFKKINILLYYYVYGIISKIIKEEMNLGDEKLEHSQ